MRLAGDGTDFQCGFFGSYLPSSKEKTAVLLVSVLVSTWYGRKCINETIVLSPSMPGSRTIWLQEGQGLMFVSVLILVVSLMTAAYWGRYSYAQVAAVVRSPKKPASS
jgi:hypothetical protein